MGRNFRKVICGVACLWLLASSTTEAQVDKYLDKVMLKNGSVLWGITELREYGVLIHLNESDSLTLSLDEIEAIKRDKLNPVFYQPEFNTWFYQINWGVTVGKRNDFSTNQVNFNASAVMGKRFNSRLGLGLGSGLYYYLETRHIPIFVELQGDLLKRRFTPAYFVRAGWSLADERRDLEDFVDWTRGGFYLEPGLGLRIYGLKHSIHLRVSYLSQGSKTKFSEVDFGNGSSSQTTQKRRFERTTFTLGVTF